jgi:hypothetical protein
MSRIPTEGESFEVVDVVTLAGLVLRSPTRDDLRIVRQQEGSSLDPRAFDRDVPLPFPPRTLYVDHFALRWTLTSEAYRLYCSSREARSREHMGALECAAGDWVRRVRSIDGWTVAALALGKNVARYSTENPDALGVFVADCQLGVVDLAVALNCRQAATSGD